MKGRGIKHLWENGWKISIRNFPERGKNFQKISRVSGKLRINIASILYLSNTQCKTSKLPFQDISVDILDIRINMSQIIFATYFWDNEYVKNEIS